MTSHPVRLIIISIVEILIVDHVVDIDDQEDQVDQEDEVLVVEHVVQQHQEAEDPTHEHEDVTQIVPIQQLDVDEVEIIITIAITITPIPLITLIIRNPIVNPLTLVECPPNN